MPKIVMIYDPTVVTSTPNVLEHLGRVLAAVVAEAASTDTVTLDSATDIDFILQPLVSGSFAADISFEIEAIGYKNRKRRLDEHAMREMKIKFIDAMSFIEGLPTPPRDQPLIWLKYVDPDGHHV